MSDVSQIRISGTLYDIKDAVARLATGSPLVASTVAGMTDTSRIYVYTGSESGYTSGNWYYYNGSSWTSGGVYQSATVETDTSLSVSGAPADAKVTGDAINNVVYVGTAAQDSHTQVLVSPTSTEIDLVTQADFDTEINDLKSQIETIEEEIEGGTGSGLTEEIKQALMNLANHVAWLDDSPTGRTYVNALYDALYPPIPATSIVISESSLSLGDIGASADLTATVYPFNSTDSVVWSSSDSTIATIDEYGHVTAVDYGSCIITATAGSVSATCSVLIADAVVVSISAVFNQGSATVYNTDSLDSLKQYLTVTAYYDDESSATITDYSLNGTLTVGTSTITVSYASKSDTFDVTVSERTLVYHWDFTGETPLVDKVASKTATANGTVAYDATNGVSFGTSSSYLGLGLTGNDLVGKDIEIEMGDMVSTSSVSTNQRLFTLANQFGFILNKTGRVWSIYGSVSGTDTWQSTGVSQNSIANKTVKISVYSTSHIDVYFDGVLKLENAGCKLGSYIVNVGSNANSSTITSIKSLKIYSR